MWLLKKSSPNTVEFGCDPPFYRAKLFAEMARRLQFKSRLILPAVLWLGAGILCAQDLDSLKQEAERKDAEWSMLASSLEQRLVRMLPCDARIQASVQDAEKASAARLAALAAYWNAAATNVAQRSATWQPDTTSLEVRASEAAKDHADSDELTETLANRQTAIASHGTSFAPVQSALASLTTALQHNEELASRRETASKDLAQSAKTLADSNRVLGDEIAKHLKLMEAETKAWGQYYAARLARAQTECAITNTPIPAPRTPGRKQP